FNYRKHVCGPKDHLSLSKICNDFSMATTAMAMETNPAFGLGFARCDLYLILGCALDKMVLSSRQQILLSNTSHICRVANFYYCRSNVNIFGPIKSTLAKWRVIIGGVFSRFGNNKDQYSFC